MKAQSLCIICLMLCIFIIMGNDVWSNPNAVNEEPVVTYLNIVNSARANGMGGCALNMVDEHSSMYNPGAVGVFHLDKIYSASFPSYIFWLPNLEIDLYLKSFGISGGTSSNLIWGNNRNYNLALGLGYSQFKIDYGSISYYDEYGVFQGDYNPIEKTDYYTMALGLEYNARLGIGYTFKRIRGTELQWGYPFPESGLESKADAYDFGILLEIPIFNFIDQGIFFDQTRENPFNLEFIPSFSYVNANYGDSLVYTDTDYGDPLPKSRNMGVSFYAAGNIGSATIVSARYSWEQHRSCIGDPDKVFKRGFEFGLLNAFHLRFGKYRNYNEEVKYSTWGFGISTGGLASYLMNSQPELENHILRYIIDHVNLSFDYALYTGDDTPLDNTKFINVSFSF